MNTQFIDRFAGLSILCVGDIMLDRFVYGDAQRLSPEAPIPVVHKSHEMMTLGGVGNTARTIHDLGGAARIVALCGDDEAGSSLRKLMSGLGINTDGLITVTERKTTEKMRIIARNQQMLRLDSEDTEAVSENVAGAVMAHIDAAIQCANAMILSDYGKGALSDAVIAHAIASANKRGIPVLIDPKGSDYRRYKGATLVTPNLAELVMASGGKTVRGNNDIVAASEALMAVCGFKAVLTTRSKDGMTLVTRKAPAVHIPTRAREVYDVSGAGDTVIGVMALGLAAGLDFENASMLANAAAGVVVGKLGTATLSPQELKNALHDDKALPSKIMNWDQAALQVELWRKQGDKIVTTNGAFDIVHEGHITLLETARGMGDRLIVMVNCDESIKRYKSPDRPINPLSARLRVLAALACVDAVVAFGHETAEDDKPLRLMAILKPDVHVKGGDYKPEDLPESQIMHDLGGEIAIVPFVDGYSTTSIVKRFYSHS